MFFRSQKAFSEAAHSGEVIDRVVYQQEPLQERAKPKWQDT